MVTEVCAGSILAGKLARSRDNAIIIILLREYMPSTETVLLPFSFFSFVLRGAWFFFFPAASEKQDDLFRYHLRCSQPILVRPFCLFKEEGENNSKIGSGEEGRKCTF